mmetsp:Transcript_11506/g.32308  ORF Transcript_11506/g.32308 Transcript_11506/m.32308 type:complete len:367 (-) Transcript_11506:61-1161(-)
MHGFHVSIRPDSCLEVHAPPPRALEQVQHQNCRQRLRHTHSDGSGRRGTRARFRAKDKLRCPGVIVSRRDLRRQQIPVACPSRIEVEREGRLRPGRLNHLLTTGCIARKRSSECHVIVTGAVVHARTRHLDRAEKLAHRQAATKPMVRGVVIRPDCVVGHFNGFGVIQKHVRGPLGALVGSLELAHLGWHTLVRPEKPCRNDWRDRQVARRRVVGLELEGERDIRPSNLPQRVCILRTARHRAFPVGDVGQVRPVERSGTCREAVTERAAGDDHNRIQKFRQGKHVALGMVGRLVPLRGTQQGGQLDLRPDIGGRGGRGGQVLEWDLIAAPILTQCWDQRRSDGEDHQASRDFLATQYVHIFSCLL